MPGRQSGVSGETCRLVRSTGVTAFILPRYGRGRGEGRVAKPPRGKEGRKLEVRCLEWRNKPPRECPHGLSKGQKPAAAKRGGGRKHRSGPSAWCRRWAAASKEASGTAGWTRAPDRGPWRRPGRNAAQTQGRV